MEKRENPPPYDDPAGQQQQFASQPDEQSQPLMTPQPTPTIVQPNITQVTVNTTQQPAGGTCPVCHVGTFKSSFTLCGWLCGIFCFPCGIIFCCCCMREKRCSHCGLSVS